MPKHTRQTLTTLSSLKADLETVRQLGYAVDREESMLGAFCVARAGPEFAATAGGGHQHLRPNHTV